MYVFIHNFDYQIQYQYQKSHVYPFPFAAITGLAATKMECNLCDFQLTQVAQTAFQCTFSHSKEDHIVPSLHQTETGAQCLLYAHPKG